MSHKAIHESAGGQHSPTYAHQHHAGVNAHNMPTFRGSVGTESIGEHLCVVTRIGAEHDGAMSIVFGSRRPAENPHPDLRIACSEAAFGWCLHSGRSFMEDGFLWTKMVETALLAVGIDALAGSTVSAGVGSPWRTELVAGGTKWDGKALERGRWARVAAQLGLLSAQPTPAPTPCGW